ncbi:N-formimino-L-glutamate deiminase [Kiloniella spongiae]|uniref:N-formimino-L-glutamate deiminase n=1 Tax=Kiloniella spongiae TaxID=1489064 RepID=A0A0H2N0Z3_9PROT|nr:formimidoylglutamate deiminase [Kiloniella spongiae]KLN62565.1 N-formimino-L-glutamate deiminase [Kiloniella spongiae]
MRHLWAKQALTQSGWQQDVHVIIGDDGRISSIESGIAIKSSDVVQGDKLGVLLPSPTNLHSHAFQRAMAGMTETRGRDPKDSFWTWRKLMYRFLDHLNPDDIEAITAYMQMEMLEAGYAAVCEFHYLHHQPGGVAYDDIGELSNRIIAASKETGIGLTLLPVLYEHGGCDGRTLGPGQIRFGNTPDRFQKLFEAVTKQLKILPDDTMLGIAPHSLRAVSRDGMRFATSLAPTAPLHMHIAEQTAEIEEIKSAWGKRPVEWLLENHSVDERWCLIHCTHMEPHETEGLARTNAVAGLCPITESSLGDGIFDGVRYVNAGGRFGVGSDSNIRISLSEELRTLEYSQRLRDRGRAVFATTEKSTGRILMDAVVAGGTQAGQRDSGAIVVGQRADLFALDMDAVDLLGKEGDAILDSYIFAGDDKMITDVWSAGRHVVKEGHHIKRDQIIARYKKTMMSLKGRI